MCVCVYSSLAQVINISPNLYQTQLKHCVTMSLTMSLADVRQVSDKISAIVDNSALSM